MAKIKIYRGISAKSQKELDEYIKDFYDKNSSFQTHGGGNNLGEGAYFTTSKQEAEGYAKQFEYSHVFEIEVDTDDFIDITKIDIDKEFLQFDYYKKAKEVVDSLSRGAYTNYEKLGKAEMDLMDAQDRALGDYVKSKNKVGVFDPTISQYRPNDGQIFVIQSKNVFKDTVESEKSYKKGSSYWDTRALNRLTDAEKQSETYIKRVKAIYNQANRNIDREIARIYKNYSKDTELDTQKLKELLTRSETQKTWEQMKRQGLDKYIKDNYKSRISRLEQLQAQIYAKAKMIYPKEELQNTMCYKGVINQSYYKTMYDTQMGTGYNFSFSTLDNNMVKALLNDSWSGKNYSQRIWGNTDILAESLSQVLGGAMISGQGMEKTTKQIRDRFNVSKYYAERLIRTETNHFNNEADAMAYEELGLEKYVFVATLDSRTSEICQEMDGKIFEFKEREEGKNFPPLHPNCRSKTRAYLGAEEEKNLQRRARNPLTGKNEVIDNISYKEWIKQFQTKAPNVKSTENSKPIKVKMKKKKKKRNTTGVVNGKNIIGEWKRRPKEFEFDIEDAVNYQGYDGTPRVVEYEEFKKLMEESNFYAERTYSANSQELLNEYQNELYNGKWYIDCSVGGSQYGKGMYCVSSYDINDNKSMGGIGWEMVHYQLLNKENRNNPYSYTEGLTIDKSAKILVLPHHEDTTYITNLYNSEYVNKFGTDKQKEYNKKFTEAQNEIDKIINNPDFNWDNTTEYNRLNKLKELRDKYYREGELYPIYDKAHESSYGKDAGTLAVEMGYDVIKAEGHGTSGSYSVILNRTKVIFCKGGSIYGN